MKLHACAVAAILVGTIGACDPKDACVGDCTDGVASTGSGTVEGDTETETVTGSVSATSTSGSPETSTTAPPQTSTSASSMTATSTVGADDDDMIGETEGLNCGGEEPIPRLFDARLVLASDLPSPPAGLDLGGYMLILSSQTGICDDPLGGFDCSDDFEYRLYLGLSADAIDNHDPDNALDFGDPTDTTGGPVPQDAPSWIQVGLTSECAELSTPPEVGSLFIESVNPETLEIDGRICNYYYTPEVGHGLAGTFATAPTCGG